MDNLIESNERTLVIFDSVCAGLAECLALVHADIRQMTEHRNQLALLEQERHQSKSIEPAKMADGHVDPLHLGRGFKGDMMQTNLDVTETSNDNPDDGDPHHLARLKLLDKRLADSFCQALNMCDQQKTSLNAKKQHYLSATSGALDSQQQRPSIFQLLLGKGFNGGPKQSNSSKTKGPKSGRGPQLPPRPAPLEPDNRMIVDDMNRQTRLAMQYSKQLEAHLFRVEDLRARYEMHLKMGLTVKSVSRAYSYTTNTTSSSGRTSPGSLGRRPHHYTSSLMVNDSSSLGTNRSSLSSLNLSSWSYSRRNPTDGSQRDPTIIRQDDACANCCQQSIMDESCPIDSDKQRYVSTISLDIVNQRDKRLNLTNLISSATRPRSNQQQRPNHPTYMQDANQIAPSQLSPIRYQCNASSQQLESPSPSMMSSHGNSVNGYTPAPRTVGQYVYGTRGDLVTPTASGTMSAGLGGGESIYVSHNSTGGSLHKSASHSSLKGKAKMKGAGQQYLAGFGQGKTTIKEFIENIERIESEFEACMGSFMLNIEDIQGFARVCQGDVFEINIKYGSAQKFKTKISVLRDNRQKCDNRQTVFKSRIADVIAIKAYECKGLGKRVLLGDKLCETRNLFTARSQLMTISLNQTGSIKLNLVITWNPLHMAPNSTLALPLSQRVQQSTDALKFAC